MTHSDVDADDGTVAWLGAVGTMSYAKARLLLPPHQDVNVRGARGETALHLLARQRGKVHSIAQLLLDGADPHATDDQGRTPRRIAQELNHTHVVRYLITHGELLRALRCRLGREPLHADVVAMMQDVSMKAFREDVRLRVITVSDSLVAAARNGELTTVQRIVESGEITVEAVDSDRGETAFSAALGARHRRVCEYLLTKKAHVYAPCFIKSVGHVAHAAINIAVSLGDVEFVRRLIAQGALRAVRGSYGDSCPLKEAVKVGSVEMVDILLAHGVLPASHRHGSEYKWPAFPAVNYDRANPVDVRPWWLLETACWLQDTRMIQHLFATFDVLTSREMIERHGALALFLAVCQGNEGIAVDLLDRGASINQPLNWGLTAMVAAISINSVSMLRLLLDRGGDPTVIHSSLENETGPNQGLLATAIQIEAVDCAYELLQMEMRPEQLDQALVVATWRREIEYVCAHLEVALPSTIEALCACDTNCPLMLDMLLSRCCAERFNISDTNGSFLRACQFDNAELVSLFLAHGVNVYYDDNGLDSELAIALQGNQSFGEEVAGLLAENGVEVHYKVQDGDYRNHACN